MAHQHHQPNNLALAFFLNLAFTIVEFIGGALTNSVAITSDALHDLGDSLSLGMSWLLDKRSGKKANRKFTFGYRRFSLLGALINSLVLVVGSVFIVREAVLRLQNPQPSDAEGMIWFAIIGISVNAFAAFKLSGGKSLNEKVVSWHLWEDVLGWAAVLVVAIILLFKDWLWLDPLLSMTITLWVLYNVLKRLRETVNVFLQGSPEGINIEDVKSEILAFKKIKSLHHSHLWSLDGEHHVFTTHLKLQHINEFDEIIELKESIKNMLNEKYQFSHLTLETELENETCALKT